MDQKWMRVLAALAMSAAVTFGAAGCKEKSPAEKAGDAIGDAAHDLKDGVKDAADDLKKAK